MMKTQLIVKDIQHRAWADMVQQQINSGLSIRDWCEQNQITTKTFYYRRKHVREELIAANQPVFAELMPPSQVINPEPYGDFRPQLTVAVNKAVISIDQNTPLNLFKEILMVVSNA